MLEKSYFKKSIEKKAEEFGLKIESIIEFDPQNVKMDLRSRWKCKFGCEYYGRASCPPNVPEFDECVRFVRSYKQGLAIIFRFEDYMEDKRRAQKLLLEVENELISDFPFAFSVFPGGCDVCEECNGKNCKKLARPSVSAMYIDITSFGVNWKDGYSVGLIFID